MSRIEKNKKRLKVFDILVKCQKPLEEKSEAEKNTCGTIVTTEIDQEGFIGKALLSVNLSISGQANDIAFKSTEGATTAFKTWGEHATNKGDKTAAEIASRNADPGLIAPFAEHLSSAAVEKLAFHRFERVDDSNKLILYDKNGRSLTFTGEDGKLKELFSPTPDANGKRVRKPDPLDCRGRFRVKTANQGTLEFFLSFQLDEGEDTELELKPGIELEGTIEYNDERKELRDIQNDPGAVRDTIVAHLVEKRGRIPAEMIANILHMLHNRLPIFWKSSPVEFLQNLTPKMFFDAISILSTQAYNQEEAAVLLDGKLYTFPQSFSAIKDIVLSALNRAIVRMHNLKATDAALLIAMGSLHFAYKKIQKHRTGRTATMHLFLKEVNHLMAHLRNSDDLNTSYPECTFFNTDSEGMEELVIKCALFRFMKIGPLEIKDNQMEVRTYVEAFLAKLTELKGSATWREYLNLGYFAKAAKKYGKTAAKYKYEVLSNQLNDIRPTKEEESELAKLLKKLHPSVSGHRPPRPKKKQGFLALLKNFRDNFDQLPAVVRQKVSIFWRNCYARMRRFFGSRRSWFYGWKGTPKVIQGSHFMGALKSAEIRTYPNLDIPRQLFIEVADLEEFGKILLSLETVAATLDNPTGMYNTVTQLRSTPAFTPLAKEQHDNLIKRAKLLGKEVVKVAAGWVLKVAFGSSGVSMALGLLALVDSSGRYMEKALQLRYLSSEALAFLDSSLDLGYLLMKLPQQRKSEVKEMRFYLNHQNQSPFVIRAQCEPKGLGINTMDPVEITTAIKRLEDELEKQKLIAIEDLSSTGKDCESLIPEQLREYLISPSITHDILVAAPDAFSLCYLWRKLKADLVQQKNTITIEDILQSVYVDNQPLSVHLDFLQQRSASSEERKVRAKFIGPMLRNLLIATVDKFSGQLGGVSFKSYDGETKLLQFQYTVQHISPTLAPGQALEYAADLLLGKKDTSKCSFVSFLFEGPQFLMDWYRYVDPKKLRAFVDDLRAYPGKPLLYKDIRNLSYAYTVTDLTDIAYSLRQSSKMDAEKVAKTAALTIMGSKVMPPLKRYGIAKLLVDLVSQAKLVKQKCIAKVLDDYEIFSASSLLDKEMFKYDCFYHQMSESGALSDAAINVSDGDINAVIQALDTAYESETKILYEGLLKSNVQHSAVAKAVFETAENLPITGMVMPLLNSFLSWVRQKKPWDSIKPILKGQRSAEWAATQKTSLLSRPVTNLEHPHLMNPYQIVIDVIFAATTGSARRRLFPVIAPVKRLKAFYAIVKPSRKSRAEMKAEKRKRRQDAEDAFHRYMQKLAKRPEHGPEITAMPTDA